MKVDRYPGRRGQANSQKHTTKHHRIYAPLTSAAYFRAIERTVSFRPTGCETSTTSISVSALGSSVGFCPVDPEGLLSPLSVSKASGPALGGKASRCSPLVPGAGDCECDRDPRDAGDCDRYDGGLSTPSASSSSSSPIVNCPDSASRSRLSTY